MNRATQKWTEESLNAAFAGVTFGGLTIVGFSHFNADGTGSRKIFMRCKCKCGKSHIANLHNIRNGNSKSCGCEGSRETLSERATVHGGARKGAITPEFSVWRAMKARCLTPTNKKYHRYGGRGITVCQRWMDFRNFLSDMGPRPPGTSIHRINNDGNYEPVNCVWADALTQQNEKGNNIRVLCGGSEMSLSQACRTKNVCYGTAWSRIKRGQNKDALFA